MNNEMNLFKQAIREALDKKIDEAINSENETLDVSKKHKIAMRTILRGKIPTEGKVSAKRVRIIAIVAIIALLLASCAIIYREEFGQLRVKIFDRYDLITHSDNSDKPTTLEEIYELSYVPAGFQLKETDISSEYATYIYLNADQKRFVFFQDTVGNSKHLVDNEHGNNHVVQIGEYYVYVAQSTGNYVYIWNDEKYILTMGSDIQLSTEDLTLIINGIKAK